MTFEYMLKERERIGIEQGRAEGHTAGLSEGHAAGLSEGRSEGLAEGAAQEKREIAKSMINKIYPIKWTQQEEGFLENGHKKKG